MSLSYPYLGTFSYALEAIARGMNRHDIIVPNEPTYKTKQLGSRHSPEFVCTPFKMLLGSIIEVLERGAYQIVATVFVDFCRLGCYSPLSDIILNDLEYDCELINLDWHQKAEFFSNFRKLTGDLSAVQAFQAFRKGWIKNRYVDLVDELLYSYGAVEITKGSAKNVAERAYQDIVHTQGMRNIRKLPKVIRTMFDKEVEIDKKARPMKVAILGELYAVIEPSINLYIMRRLNELGVVAHTPITFTRWIDLGKRLNFFKKQHHEKAIKLAKPYLGYRLGGKAQESIGGTIYYKNQGWDGVIHLYPFTCMPEIISRSILPQISKEYDIPVLSLVLDEHTGEAGLQTRLEAFVDLLERKRQENDK
ncbi:MAG: CoA protein activase [Candidatus Heimdallarchaeaceae archaeon]|jgi:predicted nucleotide-binding protein (sugar kinase/HSP70/actin superfamily)